jgi:hypothetical protein
LISNHGFVGKDFADQIGDLVGMMETPPLAVLQEDRWSSAKSNGKREAEAGQRYPCEIEHGGVKEKMEEQNGAEDVLVLVHVHV